jgi:hypothetical protein
MSLRDKLRSRGVQTVSTPTIGTPAVVGEEVSLFTAVYGEQRPRKNDEIRILHGAEAEEALSTLTPQQVAGYAVEAALRQQRQETSR